jgi:hypothetical protein
MAVGGESGDRCWESSACSLVQPCAKSFATVARRNRTGKHCMHTFPNLTIKHGKQRSQPNTRSPQRSLHELIASRLRKLLINHFEENSKSTPEGGLFMPQESKRLMIVFPAQLYNGTRGVFYISDRYATFSLGQFKLLTCPSSRPPFHNSRSRTIVMIQIYAYHCEAY